MNSTRCALLMSFGALSALCALPSGGPAVAAIDTAHIYAELTRPPLPVAPAVSLESEARIRVRMGMLNGPATLSGEGLRFTGQPLRRTSAFQAVRVSWRQLKVPGLREWTVADRDSGTTLFRVQGARFEASGQNLRLNLKPLPKRLILGGMHSQSVDVVAELPLEDYVRGVLPAEMPSNWPLEALKAQAVAARSYALYRMQERLQEQEEGRLQHSFFDVESSVMDQMYLVPVTREPASSGSPVASNSTALVDRAVRETIGEVLLSRANDRDSKPRALAAYFHADCGGHTEDARAVWGSASTPTVVDEGCPLNPNARWGLVLSIGDLGRRLQHFHPQLAAARESIQLQDIAAVGRTLTGRVQQIRLSWADGVRSDISPHDFRMAVGHERLKSTNFQLRKLDLGTYSFAGKGFGHGVGLCQWGARRLAMKGQSYLSILNHYYPGAKHGQVASIARGSEQVALLNAESRH